MKRISSVLVAFGCMFTLSAQAGAREFADIYTQCGLGAMIAPNNEVVAAITNVTWDLGTTAISSDASSEETCKGGQSQQAAFIFDTYSNLEKDLAVGNGLHLTALMHMAGYDADLQSGAATALRAEFATLVADADYSNRTRYENAENLFNALQKQIEADALKA